MDKIRVGKEDVYTIEVNDKGECIEFDLLDIELPIRCMNAGKSIEKENKIYNNKLIALEKQFKDNPKELMYKKLETDRIYCKKMREVFDKWLGEGASQKIFGDKNRIGMFEEFYTQLMPYLDKMEIDINKIKDKLISRYQVEEKL